MVFADVLRQPQVVELGRRGEKRREQLRGCRLRAGASPDGQSGANAAPPALLLEGCTPTGRRRPGGFGFTSGSPVLQLVWMRMVPMRTSLHTARSAGSIVSPARRMDTPVICSTGKMEREGTIL